MRQHAFSINPSSSTFITPLLPFPTTPPSRTTIPHRHHQHITTTLTLNPPQSPKPRKPSLRKTLPRKLLATTLAFAFLTTNPLELPNIYDWWRDGPTPPKAEAAVVAPIPINPYAKRRRVQAYERYLRGLERELEEKVVGIESTVGIRDGAQVTGDIGGNVGKGKVRKLNGFRLAALAAFVASGMSVAVVHPIDSAKIRLQGRKMGVVSEVEGVEGGGMSLYRGVWGNMLKEAPNAAIYLGVYEFVKGVLLGTGLREWTVLSYVVAGGIGDAVGSVVRVPAELVSKRLQLGLSRNMVEAVKDCFFTEVGLDITLASWAALLCRDVPYGGLQIACYEMLRGFLASGGNSGLGFDVLAGALSGWFASLVTAPADVLVTRVSSQNPQCDLKTRKVVGLRVTFQRMVENEGWRSFTDGMAQRSLYYAPMIGLFFALYEGTRFTLVHPEVITTAVIGFEQVPSYLYAYVQAGYVQVAHAFTGDGMLQFFNTAAIHVAKHLTVEY